MLVASQPSLFPIFHKLLAPDVELLHASSIAAALDALGAHDDLRIVACTVYFDDSRMFDLLRHVRQRFPALPFMCVRILDTEISRVARHGIEIAAQALGAAPFIDFAELAREHGREAAGEALRIAVLDQLAGTRSHQSP